MMKTEKRIRKEREARNAERKAARSWTLVFFSALALILVAEVALEVTMGSMGDYGALPLIALGAYAVAFVGVLVLGVRLWKAIVGCCAGQPSSADKVLLGATLWFAVGLPLGLVNAWHSLEGGVSVSDAPATYIQLGIAVVLIVLAALRFAPELRDEGKR